MRTWPLHLNWVFFLIGCPAPEWPCPILPDLLEPGNARSIFQLPMPNPLIETRSLNGEIPATRWSMVQAMGADATVRQEAMGEFAQNYWPAIYSFARKKGCSPHEAEDLTQSFLIHLMNCDRISDLAEENGRFRSWLLACLHNFIRQHWRKQGRQKRGGHMQHLSIDRDIGESWLGQIESDDLSPDLVFDRRWAAAIMERAVADLVQSYQRDGKDALAKVLVPMITGPTSARATPKLLPNWASQNPTPGWLPSACVNGSGTWFGRRWRRRFPHQMRSMRRSQSCSPFSGGGSRGHDLQCFLVTESR